MNKGKTTSVNPISLLRIKELEQIRNIVISIPADQKLRSAGLNNFYDLSSEHYFVKQLVESWYLNQNGTGKGQLISWEDENYALNLINRKFRPHLTRDK